MSVASAVHERTCHVCDAVRLVVTRTILNIQRGKQLSANRKIYEEIKRFDRDAEYHLSRMNNHTNKEYDQKIAELRQRIMWPYTDEEWEIISKPTPK